MNDFLNLGLPEPLLNALSRMRFTTPTAIQAQAIPKALEGRDVLGTAQTGTGKTAAFGIPMVARLLQNPSSHALVMTPTRELAVQVMNTLKQLIDRQFHLKTALLIGGEPMPKQFQQLRQRPRLVVGTPGRINDHLNRQSLYLDRTDFLVLDEMDRMLDMGFSAQIAQVTEFLPPKRQTLLFSATLPKNILQLAETYLHDPARISVGSATTPVSAIKQELLRTPESDKFQHLITQIEQRTGSIIVFVKTKWSADLVANRLRREQHDADAIHGDLRHTQRERVIRAFRERKYRIMVATDIAARGLDIPHIEHVINYDLPQCPEDYIHRIGRTARAGATGSAICFITPADNSKWQAIHRLMHPEEAAKGDKQRPLQSHGRHRQTKRRPEFGFKKRSRSAGRTGAIPQRVRSAV